MGQGQHTHRSYIHGRRTFPWGLLTGQCTEGERLRNSDHHTAVGPPSSHTPSGIYIYTMTNASKKVFSESSFKIKAYKNAQILTSD